VAIIRGLAVGPPDFAPWDGPTSGNPTRDTQSAQPAAKVPPHKSFLGVGQESSWRGYGATNGANDKLAAHDRHAVLNSGTEKTGRDPGTPDPQKDGPARPSLRIINRSLNPQQGSDATAAHDDLTRQYNRTPDGRFFVGEQGSGWSPVYGGVPGLWIPYGSYAGFIAGPVQGVQSPIEQGSVGDGPHSVFSGPPHGLHTATMPDYSQTIGRYMALPQQIAGRVDRPDNSNIAGQSYSQTVAPQGQVGTVAAQVSAGQSRTVKRIPGSGWRGAA